MRIVLTADDYGASLGVSAAIEELAERGAIDAVSVMVHDGAHLSGLSRLTRTHVEVGLHLVLTRERPLTGALARSGLCDRDGRLPPGYASLFARLWARPGLLPLLVGEIEAQIARFTRSGLRLSFVNGHEHTHLFPMIWPVVAALSERAGAAVRAAIGRPLGLSPDGALAAASRIAWSLRPAAVSRILSPVGGAGVAGRMTLDAVERQLARAAEARDPLVIAELVAHPGPGSLDDALLSGEALGELLVRRGFVRGGSLGDRWSSRGPRGRGVGGGPADDSSARRTGRAPAKGRGRAAANPWSPRSRARPALVSVVAAAHDEAGCIRELYRRVAGALHDIPLEIVLVDDGSTDATFEEISRLAGEDPRVRGVRLARNEGHQRALLYGMSRARGDVTITLDADLQHPPEHIPAMIEAWRDGGDVVHMVRRDQGGAARVRDLLALGFYWLFNRVADVPVGPGSTDFRLLDRRSVGELLARPDPASFLRAEARRIGGRHLELTFEASPRFSGASSYTVVKLTRLAARALAAVVSAPRATDERRASAAPVRATVGFERGEDVDRARARATIAAGS